MLLKTQINFLTNPIFFKPCLVIFWNSHNQDVSHFQKPVLSPASFDNFLNQTRVKSRQLSMLYFVKIFKSNRFSNGYDVVCVHMCVSVCLCACGISVRREGKREREERV